MRKPRRRNNRFLGTAIVAGLPRTYLPILRLWTLRLIQIGGGIIASRHNRPDLSREALETAGLEACERWGREEKDAVMLAAEQSFQVALARAENMGATIPMKTTMARNIRRLGEAVGLTSVDCEILHFIALAFIHPGLINALEQVGSLSAGALQTMMSRVLGISEKQIAKSLDVRGHLCGTGLMAIDNNGAMPFFAKVEPLGGLLDRLSLRHGEIYALFKGVFSVGPKATLKFSHYPHLSKDLSILEPYLQSALETNSKGVNVLIHGTPGTGKTELARTLASKLNATLFEVATERHNGDPIEGNERFRCYRLTQSVVCRQQKSLVLIDEIEDLFRPREESSRYSRSNVSGIKGWVNKTLEENQTPSFWVTNQLQILDDAFIRRFDYVIHLDNPPKKVRRRMLDDHLTNLAVEVSRKERLSEHEGLSPAVICNAAKVVNVICSGRPQADAGQILSQVIENTLEALGHSRIPRRTIEVVTDYRPELLNVDCDLKPVLAGLQACGQGRLCFYGPPGTGKTAYGRHIATAMDRPLIVKRASDLLSMYVGGTEKNLARMFEEARSEGAVLLLDEADGFLQERSGSQRNYEVSQVNEALVQIEEFAGIFIASTNIMNRMDAAALRRFDMKVRFDYLQPEQAWIMFQDAAIRVGLQPAESVRNSITRLTVLTPGDFATVIRQARLNRPSSPAELVSRLEAECQMKPEYRRNSIGFVGKVS